MLVAFSFWLVAQSFPFMVGTDNAIFVSDKAKQKVTQLMQDAGVAGDPSYFLRVSVVGGGCSGLSYKLDFDNEIKPMDQVFEDNGVKVVTDLKSFLYLGKYRTTVLRWTEW
jgi:iron-sulfur cluster assembly protein